MAEYSISHTNEGSSTVYKTGIVIPVYNRYWLLKACLRSLAKSDLKDAIIVFVNDASEDPRISNMLSSFKHKDARVVIFERSQRPKGGLLNGLHYNLQFTIEYLFELFKCKYVCILDSDTLVKPWWLTTELALYAELENKQPLIVSGFNTIKHPELKSFKHFYRKAKLGGINMLFNRDTFFKICVPLPTYWDVHVVERMKVQGAPMVCTRPSVIQHTGLRGTFSYLWNVDFAYDYLRPYSLWLAIHHLYQGFYKFMLLVNDNVRHPLKRYIRCRRAIS